MGQKIAIPLDGVPSIVLLGNDKRMSRKAAIEAGYRIADADAIAKADAINATNATNAFELWRTRVSCLPEARERPAAIAELIASQPLMSIETVRAYLRGLPVETKEENTSVPPDNANDPRAARLAEISRNMQVINRERGYAPKSRASGQRQVPRDIEPAKLRRLAELRLAAIDVRGNGGVEARNLRYALGVLDATGAPPATVFHQLGIDTSKFVNA
ncbi:hypothetical protein [Bradyrhizobium sp. BRP56]|uniref:hypothetical protein n=1 Tax=Bradyrhizobium sp. BRP56 TaxID=2793819 RepID=UPI001CD364CA|nr:hypothetical protein [Bradyrhizobium sp. BRP56]MCA1401931.1 hypothetical protein [Bradyrhizobium sp. BRP56]